MNRIINSLRYRIIYPYQSNYFDKTKSGRALAAYRDKHAGERCFFIGNGPSLRAGDLTRLHERGEICFAFNRIYNIFDQTPWRPDYYISQDEKMLKGCMEEVSRAELGTKFIPINCKWYHDITVDNAQWFMMKAPIERDGKPMQFSSDPARMIFQAGTGMYTAAQLAAYMGFRKIYLIGVDHHFQISQNSKGEIIVDNTVKDYFTDKYNPDKSQLYIPNTEKSTLTYIAMKEQCDRRGIKVFNATRGGKLEIFPRIDFDQIFKEYSF